MEDVQLHRDEWMGTLWPPSVEAEAPARTEPGVIAPEGVDTTPQRRAALERRALDALARLLAEG